MNKQSLLAILFCGSTLLSPALAQEVSAGLTGRVTDSSGGAVIGASVTARDEERGATWSAATNEDGIYAFPRIPNGSYTLKVEAAAFVRSVHSNVALEINQRGRVDIVLQLGAVSESVEISDQATLLQTETTQMGAVIGARVLDDSPLLSRNVIELTLLIPGVTATDPSTFNTGTRADSSGGRPFVNGNREQANNFLLDGIDSNQVSDNLGPYQPNPDALQEMRVITSNASECIGGIRELSGRRHQYGDQVRHEPVPRQPLRALSQR